MNLTQFKPVRSFKKPPSLYEEDTGFKTWNQKSWQKRVIEVGCGTGIHSIQYGIQNPDHAVIAIERTKNKFSSFRSRINSHQLKNLFAINKDALYWLPQNILKNEIDAYYFLYPNPYPKEKQANKRWHRNPFFEYILYTLKPGGFIHFASNESGYIKECEFYCKEFWNLNIHEKKFLRPNGTKSYRTHFEKKYLLRGQTCYNLVFEK